MVSKGSYIWNKKYHDLFSRQEEWDFWWRPSSAFFAPSFTFFMINDKEDNLFLLKIMKSLYTFSLKGCNLWWRGPRWGSFVSYVKLEYQESLQNAPNYRTCFLFPLFVCASDVRKKWMENNCYMLNGEYLINGNGGGFTPSKMQIKNE